MEYCKIIGAGGHAKVIIDSIELNNNFNIESLIIEGDSLNGSLFGYEIRCWDDIKKDDLLFIAIGNNFARKRISSKLLFNSFIKIIHPSCYVSNRVMILDGTIVMAGVSIISFGKIGRHCIINTNASLEYDCILNDYVHISPNVTLGDSVEIGEGTHIGAGATIIPGIKIGRWVTVGAGAVIIQDIPDFATVVGNPGRLLK